ncbi:MAG TPA: tyrosine--tRNA ligase [Thermoleophilaceae bacterium]|nr:tyrosine--tRNA ligase [Thermoleophilaceae bacterium]
MASPHEQAEYLLRNAVEALPAGELERQLARARPLRVKLGIDPTAPDIHLGHTVVLEKLREFQDFGHTVVLIIGDYTARVGDPSGRSAMRPVLSGEEIDHNAETYQRQAFKILDPERTEVRRNGEWLDMPAEDLFRLTRHATVAQLLAREDFANRWKAQQPISVLELLYPLLQGFDSVAIKADVELGGTDQHFNLLLGREIQQAYGVEPQSILTMPILPGTDGVARMSKSSGNYIGVDEPPEEIFGKVMSIPDDAMPLYYSLLTHERFDRDEHPNQAKRRLARILVDRFHGDGAGEAAEQHFDRLFKQREAPEEMPEFPLPAGDSVHLPALLREAFGVSGAEARRLLAGGGVRVNGDALGGDELDLEADRLRGAILQLGRRRFVRLVDGSVG